MKQSGYDPATRALAAELRKSHAPRPGSEARSDPASDRIRRFDAAHVLSELRKPALQVAPGTIEAATARIRGLIGRIRLINDQLIDAGRQIDRLCKKLSEKVADKAGETARGQKNET